jgi:hypothetical protein
MSFQQQTAPSGNDIADRKVSKKDLTTIWPPRTDDL